MLACVRNGTAAICDFFPHTPRPLKAVYMFGDDFFLANWLTKCQFTAMEGEKPHHQIQMEDGLHPAHPESR